MSNLECKNFSFIRVHPIKEWERGDLKKSRKLWGLTGNVAHDLRFIHTPNADEARISLNQIVCAATDWKLLSATKKNLAKIGITGPEFLAELAFEKIAEKGIVVHQNLVKTAMLLMAVSPEYIRDGDLNNEPNPEKSKKLLAGSLSFLRKKYGDRLLMAVYHDDEQNPHLSAYILPIIEKRITKTGRSCDGMKGQPRETRLEWRLSFADFFRRDKRITKFDKVKNKKVFVRYDPGPCSIMQTEYAEELCKHGLDVQRGVRKADEDRALPHETTKERSARLRTPPTEIEGMNFEQLRNWAAQVIPVIAELPRAQKERDHYQKTAGYHQKRANELEKSLDVAQRGLSVENVIKKLTGLEAQPPGLGLELDSARKDIEMEFLLPNGQRIGLIGKNGFENLTPEIPFLGENANRLKGKGAISAVKYITGWSHSETTKWLADVFGDESASFHVAKEFREEVIEDRDDPERNKRKDHAQLSLRDLEVPDDATWPEAMKTLTKAFNCSPESIEVLKQCNSIKTNSYGHLLFGKTIVSESGMSDAGNIVIDLKYPNLILAESGEGIHVHPGDGNKQIFCSSPLEALAIKSSSEHKDATVIAVGNHPTDVTQKSLEYLIKTPKVINLLAENLTIIGQALAAWFNLHFSNIKKLVLPKEHISWIDSQRKTATSQRETTIKNVEPYNDTNQQNL